MGRRLCSLVVSCALASLCAACPGFLPPEEFVWHRPAPRAFSPGKQQVRIVFGGDVSVGRGVAEEIHALGNDDPKWVWSGIAPTLASADLVFANLECVLTDSDDGKIRKTWTIRGDPKNVDVLTAGGIGVVSVANNHALDFGFPGFFSTLKTTSAAGLQVTGVVEDRGQEPLIVQVGTMKVGFLAFNQRGDEWMHLDWRPRDETYDREDPSEALALVKATRPKVDQLIVSMHWGPELAYAPLPWQIEQAHALIDAGADLVIGQHPHTEQAVEEYRGKLIAYSLGDLVFDKKTAWIKARTSPRFLLAVDFDGTRMTDWKQIAIQHDPDAPVRDDVRGLRPVLAPAQDTASFVRVPDTSRWRASAAIEEAHVERDGKRCKSWETERDHSGAGWLRWMDARWACPNEDREPGDSVGATVELSNTVARPGIWASPSDRVVVAWDKVPLGKTLQGTAGWPDAVVDTEDAAKAPNRTTVALDVRLDGQLVRTVQVPFEKGWQTFTLDTSVWAGSSKPVVVEVRGARRAMSGFVFDLAVP